MNNQIESLMKELDINKYTVDKDGFVNVDEDVILKKSITIKKARKIPIKFGVINGNFDCSFCLLITLEGVAHTINGDFNCSYNNLKNLSHSPKIVTGDYLCHSNKGLSLSGVTEEIGKDFDASNCELSSTKNAPKFINGSAIFADNNIRTIGGLKVKKDLDVSNNKLVSIGDNDVGGNINHSNNPMSPDDELDRNWW